MTTMNVLDSAGLTVAIEKPLAPGRAAAAASRPVALSTEDIAAVGALTETAPASDTASSGLNGRLQRIAQRLTTLLAVFPTTIDTNSGSKSASTIRVVLATDQPSLTNAQPTSIADGSCVTLGSKADAKSTATDTTAITAMQVWKQISASVQALVTGTVLAAGTALIGRAVADASAATGGVASTARLPSAAASTNATNVKTSAGRIYQVSGKNNAAYDVFMVLYDSATNPPVPGTTTIRKKLICPAGQAFVYDWYVGLSFASGIGYAFTKLVADADTTVLVAADITAFNLDYV